MYVLQTFQSHRAYGRILIAFRPAILVASVASFRQLFVVIKHKQSITPSPSPSLAPSPSPAPSTTLQSRFSDDLDRGTFLRSLSIHPRWPSFRSGAIEEVPDRSDSLACILPLNVLSPTLTTNDFPPSPPPPLPPPKEITAAAETNYTFYSPETVAAELESVIEEYHHESDHDRDCNLEYPHPVFLYHGRHYV